MDYRHDPGFDHRPPYAPPRHDPQPDIRPGVTGRIWMWAMIMMGIAVPISAITESSAVPLCIIFGAALSSACVWMYGGSRGQEHSSASEQAEATRLRAKVGELEERLCAMEAMTSYERAASQRAAHAATQAPHSFDASPFAPQPIQHEPMAPLSPRPRNPGAMEG